MSFSKEVETKDGNTKVVTADSQEALDEAVTLAQGDESPVAPDINNPEDGNKVVSPDNTHTNENVGGVTTAGVPIQPGKSKRDAKGHFASNK